MKPGDILTSAEGKTVEIINTDAEGRLILGDGSVYARQLGATHLVDVATLTGACVVALGKTHERPLRHAGPGGSKQVRRASERAGDRSWPMPVFDDYKDQLKSEIADFTNTGGRAGGAITRGALHQGVSAGGLALGPPGHRRHGVGGRGEAVSTQGRRATASAHRSAELAARRGVVGCLAWNRTHASAPAVLPFVFALMFAFLSSPLLSRSACAEPGARPRRPARSSSRRSGSRPSRAITMGDVVLGAAGFGRRRDDRGGGCGLAFHWDRRRGREAFARSRVVPTDPAREAWLAPAPPRRTRPSRTGACSGACFRRCLASLRQQDSTHQRALPAGWHLLVVPGVRR